MEKQKKKGGRGEKEERENKKQLFEKIILKKTTRKNKTVKLLFINLLNNTKINKQINNNKYWVRGEKNKETER